jgi:hypothetical protein
MFPRLGTISAGNGHPLQVRGPRPVHRTLVEGHLITKPDFRPAFNAFPHQFEMRPILSSLDFTTKDASVGNSVALTFDPATKCNLPRDVVRS